MVLVEVSSVGRAWLDVSRRILADGEVATYDGLILAGVALGSGAIRLARRAPECAPQTP